MSNNDDSDDLEALFDSIVMASTPDAAPVESPKAEAKIGSAPAAQSEPAECCNETVYSQIGHMTRNLHDTLRGLGYDKSLETAVNSMPDTKDRLNYIAALTQQAAERALSATEVARPIQEKLGRDAASLSQNWQRLFDKQMDVNEFKSLVTSTRSFLTEVPSRAKATNEQLTEIMMAQDFQDLTGQVIKKIIEIAQQVEQQLVKLLVESTPPEKMHDINPSLLNGPVINAAGRSDVVTSQEQVDELLDSLGF